MNYQAPHYLREPGVSELEVHLEKYLQQAVNTLLEAGAGLDCAPNPAVQQLKNAVRRGDAGASEVSVAQLFENIKFARLMKGRLWFYGQDVLWFDSEFLIRNELNRIRANFYETPLRLFARLVYQEDMEAERALQMMQGDVLEADEVAACRRFAAIAAIPKTDDELKLRALAIAEIFDPFLCALEKIMQRANPK